MTKINIKIIKKIIDFFANLNQLDTRRLASTDRTARRQFQAGLRGDVGL